MEAELQLHTGLEVYVYRVETARIAYYGGGFPDLPSIAVSMRACRKVLEYSLLA